MGRPLYTNNAASALAAGITSTQTTIQVQDGMGNLFPTPVGGDYFYVTLTSISIGGAFEIMQCTARSGDTMTVVRGVEGTSAQSFNIGDNVQLRITAAGMNFLTGQAVTSTEEETQTATQGQTVFTLVNFDYAPGTNNLAVFVNGSKQISGVNYSETTVNTVTFNTGLNVGDIVEFLVGVSVASGTLYANDVLYNEGGTGAVTRTVETKLQEMVSVKDFGAVGDGVTDDTAAFGLAAKNTTSAVTLDSTYTASIARAPINKIYIPAGEYILSSVVDTGTNNPYWILDEAAIISNYSYLNGVAVRAGEQTNSNHYGTMSYATTASYIANGGLNAPPQVLGFTSPSDLALYPDRDSVTVYASNTGPAPTVNISTATYTATTIIPGTALTAAQIKELRIGMIIDTKHTTKYSGFITGWASNGTSITVSNWYLSGGGTTPVTPANGTGAYVNPITKIWAHNANVGLDGSSHANGATGFEIGIFNNKAANLATWGFDCINLGSNRAQYAHLSRGTFEAAYYVEGDCDIGLFYNTNQGAPLLARNGATGIGYYSISGNGNVEMGSQETAQVTYLDIHSSGTTADYDARIQCAGGSSSAANGTLTFDAALINVTNTFRPTTDNAANLGFTTNRWATVYAGTGSINTSDEREKQDIKDLSDAEKQAAIGIKGLIKSFRFKDSVAQKGDKARIHFGVMAQQVAEAFKIVGLNPDDYAMFCYDEWKEQPEILDDAGLVIQPYMAAGNRYGIRYDELLAFVISAI